MNADTQVTTAVLIAVMLVAAITAVAGCADLAKRPVAVQVKTVEVPRVVPVPCVAAEDIPPRTPTAMPDPKADVARKAAGAYVDLHNLAAENEQLRALLIPCLKGATP